MLKNKKMQSGFTLVELMIAVGILAILAAMAYPTYQNFIIRSHLEAARGEMMDNIRMMEKFYAENRTMCGKTKSDGTCDIGFTGSHNGIQVELGMPKAIENPQVDSYNTFIRADAFNGNTGNSYIILSQPNVKSNFSQNTIDNKEVHLLYYSNGSGFVKCTSRGATKALAAAKDGEGCSVM